MTKNNPNHQKTKLKYVTTFGLEVFNDKLSRLVLDNNTKVLCCISPNSYGLMTKDPEFKNAMLKSDVLVLDGVYFALASIFLTGKNIKRNQGPDVFNYYMKYLNETRGKAFFLGSSTKVLSRIKARAATEYPGIKVGYYSPPYKPEFSIEDNNKMIESVNDFMPDVLFVGMTTPKQDKWSIKHRGNVNAKIMVNIGNVFDWYARTQKRIHPIWFKLRIGWLVRIFLRPEIFKRNIGNQTIFFWHLILSILRIKDSY